MKTRILEVRDIGTHIPVMAIKMEPDTKIEKYYFARSGGFYAGCSSVMLIMLYKPEAQYDPFAWGGAARTMKTAHEYIRDNFDRLKDGDVVDVEYILEETTKPKISERFNK